ncbi:hypothetical protein HK105_201779 [Polyrhizophydium stewartii]|uniref:Uncharacterized protein n=1 Tax=Polyrhizophydium stewartii TaxID=2732419 RepID=A0ABR4NFZ2_9FUNG|nr:hypothetical protein HK105_001704 [Polyrhizophydium stewartii]
MIIATALSLAVASLAAAQATNATANLGLNPALTPACATAAAAQFVSIATSCPGITPTLLNSTSLPTVSDITGLITGFCSDSCKTATGSFAGALKADCGDQVLFVAAPTAGAAASSTTTPLTAATVGSYFDFGQAVGCFKTDDGSKFCIADQYPTLAPLFSGNTTTSTATESILANPSFLCSSCAKREVTAALAAKTFAEYKSIQAPLTAIQAVQASCSTVSPTPAKSTGNGAVPASSSGSIILAGVLAGAAGLAAMLL